MTVAELIDVLRGYPPALRVVVDGYEEGYDDVSTDRVFMSKIGLDTGTESWQGRHGDPRDRPGTDPDAVEIVEALVIRRASW